jgi:alcohol dehydrogenase class IV
MLFDFATANQIIFGCGAFQKVGTAATTMGERALVITGKSVERADPLVDMLISNKIGVELLSIPHEPTTDMIMKGAKLAREWRSDFVIGMGGGSVIDSGKAIAALLNNPGDLFDYLEVIGRGEPINNPPAPYIAIPTTSGTGSEVTKNSVISSPEHQVKVR